MDELPAMQYKNVPAPLFGWRISAPADGAYSSGNRMSPVRSDAFVLFGATGDLAYKKIFPALQAIVEAGDFDGPIIGISRGTATLER